MFTLSYWTLGLKRQLVPIPSQGTGQSFIHLSQKRNKCFVHRSDERLSRRQLELGGNLVVLLRFTGRIDNDNHEKGIRNFNLLFFRDDRQFMGLYLLCWSWIKGGNFATRALTACLLARFYSLHISRGKNTCEYWKNLSCRKIPCLFLFPIIYSNVTCPSLPPATKCGKVMSQVVCVSVCSHLSVDKWAVGLRLKGLLVLKVICCV